ACFFQAPHGVTRDPGLARLNNLLTAIGFFVEFNDDTDPSTLSLKPDFITQPGWRYRLMQLVEPAEDLGVYKLPGKKWIESSMGAGRKAHPIADNVIAILFQARNSDGLN